MGPFTYILLLITTTNTQLYDPALFSLGSNLIVNPTFSTPDIGGVLTQYMSGGILGWNFVDSQIITVSTLCSSYGNPCSTNFTQAIDLDGMYSFDIISQSVSIGSTNQYLLSVEWLEAAINPVGKNFEIKINSTSFANITTTTNNYVGKQNQFLVNGNLGSMNISFQQTGGTP